MRIFSVFFHPSLSFTAVGGAEKRFLRVLNVWCSEKVNITVVDPDPTWTLGKSANCEIVNLAGPLHTSKKGLLHIYLEWVLWVIKACFSCPSMARRRNCDVILATNNTLPSMAVAYMVHLMTKTPLCVVAHHLDLLNVNEKANFASAFRVYRKARFGVIASLIKAAAFVLILSLLRRSSLCIAVSNYTAKILLSNGISPNKVYVSGNGVDVDYIECFMPLGAEYEGVFVGRIARDKGIFDLVRAWQRVSIGRPESKLAVVGTGPDLAELGKLVRRSGMSRGITLFGNCDDRTLYGLLKASKIFVFPSMFEGWGLAVGEALACGLPVVCYDIPALREVFGECRSVFFVPVGDLEGLANAVKDLLGRGDFGNLAFASKAFARRFDWKKVASRDLQIINTLVSG